MNAMTHKGYAARVEFDAEDRIFVGRVIGIRDVVSFHGETVSELETRFVKLSTTISMPVRHWANYRTNHIPANS